MREVIDDKIVLVNGSCGALGIELCRLILEMGCRRLIILDRYESYLNETASALLNEFSEESVFPIVIDADNFDSLEKVFETYRPSLVIQGGMRKYIPPIGVDLGDLGGTNYGRTFNLAKAAAKFQCENFVLISSLIAAQGGNLIADSLRIAEVSLEHFFYDTATRPIIARLCDVLENRGGTVSVIEEQIRTRGAVNLPSPEVQIRLVSKRVAAEFILQCLVDVKKNSSEKRLFSCDIATPFSLIEITRNLAALYGLKIGTDVVINYTGQRHKSVSVFLPEIAPATSPNTSEFKYPIEDLPFSSEEAKAAFKDFVLVSHKKADFQGWKKRTGELLRLCQQFSL